MAHYQDKTHHKAFLKLLIKCSDAAKKADEKATKIFLHDVLSAMKDAGMHWDTKDDDGKVVPGDAPALSTIKKHKARCIEIIALNGEKNGVSAAKIAAWKVSVGKPNILMIKDVPETSGKIDDAFFDNWN